MPNRAKVLVALTLAAACLAVWESARFAADKWLLFTAYLAGVLLSSGMKVCLLRSDSTMTVDFPFILLAVLQLSPLQAMALAALSVFAQCKFRVQKLFSLVQIVFNVGSAVNATAACWLCYTGLRVLHLPAAPALALGALAYFLVSSIPVALIIAWSSGASAPRLWAGNFLWFLPFYWVGAALAALAYFLGTHYGVLTAMLELPAAYTIYRSYNAQIARIRDREQHAAEMEALHVRTIESLAMAIEAKDHDTHDHLLRVRVYVTEIGQALGLNKADMQAVKTAALLHDIGKLAVPERIINKPGKLSPEEFEIMKTHTVVGADILERVRFPYPVVPIVRAHHEWWNGQGYPDGLRGEAIPIGARILTAVDSFDALTSDRSYRRAMAAPEAMAILHKLSGTQFDPRVIEMLERRYPELDEQVRREGEKLVRLDTETRVARGAAPGAGFEQIGGKAASSQVPQAGANLIPGSLAAALGQRMQALLTQTEVAGLLLGSEDTLMLLAGHLLQLVPGDCMLVFLYARDGLKPLSMGTRAGRFFQAEKIPFGEGISGWVAKHEQSIVNGNATVEPNYVPQERPEEDLKSALSLPLRDPEKSIFGVLTLYAQTANAFSREHLQAVEAAEPTITLALKNALQAAERRPERTEPVTALRAVEMPAHAGHRGPRETIISAGAL